MSFPDMMNSPAVITTFQPFKVRWALAPGYRRWSLYWLLRIKMPPMLEYCWLIGQDSKGDPVYSEWARVPSEYGSKVYHYEWYDESKH